jgi:hypothetical protein
VKHVHTADCFLKRNGRPVYTPCREDGLDRNLREMNLVDFETRLRTRNYNGLTFTCTQE